MELDHNEEEVRQALKHMPREKVPSLDGMTSEALLAFWSFIHKDFMEMLITFGG